MGTYAFYYTIQISDELVSWGGSSWCCCSATFRKSAAWRILSNEKKKMKFFAFLVRYVQEKCCWIKWNSSCDFFPIRVTLYEFLNSFIWFATLIKTFLLITLRPTLEKIILIVKWCIHCNSCYLSAFLLLLPYSLLSKI